MEVPEQPVSHEENSQGMCSATEEIQENIRNFLLGYEPGLCSFCGKQFATISALNKHHLLCKMNSKNKQLQIICACCGKIFSHKSSLSRHESVCREGSSNKFKCSVCFAEFARVDNYRRHYRECTGDVGDGSSKTNCKLCHKLFSKTEDFEGHDCITKKRLLLSTCLYEDCKMNFYRRSQLTRHLRKAHGNRIEEDKRLVFATAQKFLEWKHSEEQATNSCFTKRSGTRDSTDYYYCQLDGSSKPHCKTGQLGRKTERKVKRGTVKKDRICLAKMKVKMENDGTFSVVYQPTHSHRLDIVDDHPHVLLMDTVKYINKQLSMGIAPKKCFKTINNNTLNSTEHSVVPSKQRRPVLVSGINALALSKRIKIKNSKDDAISVMIRVALLSKETPNPIILYKPLGEEKVIGSQKIDKLVETQDLFILGIQTKEQRLKALQNTEITLSISWVDDTNAYGYRLLTLVVPDEHNRGFPVAYFILNKFNEATLLACFRAFRDNFTELTTSTIVLPDSLVVVDALQKTFGNMVTYIYCLSSVHKEFLQLIEEMVHEDFVSDVYKSLCSIIACDNEIDLANSLRLFFKSYSEPAYSFVMYFKQHYMSTIERWTMAYRMFPHGNINTTILNESMHNKIKAANLKDSTSRRLDDLINILLDLEDDEYKQKYIEDVIGIPNGLGDISIRHAECINIPDECIKQLYNDTWMITVQIPSKKVYEVIQCTDKCINNICYFTCNSPDCIHLCSHLYACSCEDKNPLCVHIHKLRTFLYRNHKPSIITNDSSDEEFDVYETEKVHETVDEYIPAMSSKTSSEKLVKIKQYLEHLSGFIENKQVDSKLIDHLENHLQELVTVCETSQVQGSADPNSSSFLEQKPTLPDLVKNEVVLKECVITDDLTRYEFEYVHQNILNDDTSANDELDGIPEPIVCLDEPESFTPSIYYSDLNQVVIKVGTEELTLLHLKCLDPCLRDEEVDCIQQCSGFCDRFMYPTLINSFLLNLQMTYNQIVPINSDIACTLKTHAQAKPVFAKELLEKDVFIMPMNLSNKYWTCVAVYIKEKEIIYFNPYGKMRQKDEIVITHFLNSILEDAEWSITIPNYNEEIEDDKMGYGVHVCHFVEEIAKQTDLTPLSKPNLYRKRIYESIVGGCLRANIYSDSLCGKCNNFVCPHKQDEIADLSICCGKCNQWYHILCLDISEIDVYNTDFTCPT